LDDAADIIKVLKRIEKLLASSSTTASGKTSSVFKSMIGGAAKKTADPTQAIRAIVKEADPLSDSLGTLNSQVRTTAKGFQRLNAQLRRASTTGFGPASINTPSPLSNNPAQTYLTAGMKTLGTSGSQVSSVLSTFGKALSGIPMKTIELGKAFDVLKDFVVAVTSDYFTLAKSGVVGSTAMLNLYEGAFKAGMSLQDFTSTIVANNMSMVARMRNMDDVTTLTTRNAKSMASLGVFGKDLAIFNASIANTGTTMGIPIAKAGSQVDAAAAAFKDLRDATMLTTDQFTELYTHISNDSQTQREMLGLNVQQRQARVNELVSMGTWAKSLNLANGVTNELIQTMMKQRGLTVADRFAQRNSILQAGGVLGMQDQASRAAELAMKGRALKGKDLEEFVGIIGDMKARMEQLQEQGAAAGPEGLALQNLMDQMQQTVSNLPTDVAGAVKLGKDAGSSANKDFGGSVGQFGQFVGNLITWGNGLKANPLGAALEGIGAVAGLVLLPKLLGALPGPLGALGKGLGALVGKFGASAGTLAATAATTTASTSAFTKLGSLFTGSGGTTSLIEAFNSAVDNVNGAIKSITKSLLMPIWNTIVKTFKSIAALPGKTLDLALDGIFKLADAALDAGEAILAGVEKIPNAIKAFANWISKPGEIITQAGEIASAAWKSVTGVIGNIGKALTGNVQSLLGDGKALVDGVKSWASAILGDAGPVVKSFLGGFTGLANGLIKGLTGPFQAVISGIMEIFTGDITAALMPEGGFINGVTGILLAAFRGVFTGVTSIVDMLFGDTFEKWFGGTLTNTFDKVFTMLMSVQSRLLKMMVDGLIGLLGNFAPDALKSFSESLTKKIDATDTTLDKLSANGKLTLTDIGDANQQATKATKATTAEISKLSKQLDTAAEAAAQANTIALGDVSANRIYQDSKALIATPVNPPQKDFVESTVNKDTSTVSVNQPDAEFMNGNKNSSDQNKTMVSILQSILDKLTTGLEIDKTQAELLSSLTDNTRPRSVFSDVAQTVNNLNNRIL